MSIYFVLLLILISCVIFVFCVLFLMSRFKRKMIYFCLFFVPIGFIIYTAGYLSSGAKFTDVLFAMLHGLFSTARMLSLNDDYGFLSNVQWLTGNKCIQIIFWFCHVSGLMLIQTALISLFGRKLMDNFRLFFGSHKEVYIIKGTDKNAFFLAENIVTHDAKQKQPDNKRLIVFLMELEGADDEKKTYEKAARFNGIVKVLDREHDLQDYLQKTRLGKWSIIKKEKYNIILMPQNTSTMDDVQLIVEYAKENNVKPDKLDIFMFISSEWEREKIEEITQANEKFIDVTDNKKEKTKRKYPYTFHIVNEVDLLTRQMINKNPPYKCHRLNFSDGMALCNFTVMIIGFGPVGQSALLRLIMNGQFIGSRMRAIVIDKDIENLCDCFEHRYPGLKLCCDIKFENINVQHADFFKLLDNEKNVDYIVTALHSDEMNKQTALDIKQHYERKGIKELPFIAVAELNGSLRETKQAENNEVNQNENKDEKIFVFGSREEVYKESVIIRQEADRIAKAVNDVYNDNNPKRAKEWIERDWFTQESNRAIADYIPTMLYIAGVDRNKVPKEGPLVKNNDTLEEILAQTEHLRWNAFHAAMGWGPISVEEMRQRFGDTSTKAPKERLHVCLVPWDKLEEIDKAYNEDFKKYDFDIIMNIPKFLKAAEKAKEDA